jgi:hypothetical protein
MSFGKRKKAHGNKSGEYGGRQTTVLLCLVRNSNTDEAVHCHDKEFNQGVTAIRLVYSLSLLKKFILHNLNAEKN